MGFLSQSRSQHDRARPAALLFHQALKTCRIRLCLFRIIGRQDRLRKEILQNRHICPDGQDLHKSRAHPVRSQSAQIRCAAHPLRTGCDQDFSIRSLVGVCPPFRDLVLILRIIGKIGMPFIFCIRRKPDVGNHNLAAQLPSRIEHHSQLLIAESNGQIRLSCLAKRRPRL